MKRRIPIGISDFKKVRTGNYDYVDKSMFIADVVNNGADVILLPRPRRFGKTINRALGLAIDGKQTWIESQRLAVDP